MTSLGSSVPCFNLADPLTVDGAVAHVLCGEPALTRHLGLRTSRKSPVYNGPIECRWLRYEIGDEPR